MRTFARKEGRRAPPAGVNNHAPAARRLSFPSNREPVSRFGRHRRDPAGIGAAA